MQRLHSPSLTLFFSLYVSVATADSNPYSEESAIYRIEVPYSNSNQIGIGTGVLVAWDKILTNCHVVKNHPGWPRAIHRKTGHQFNVTKHYNLGSHDACILVGSFAGTRFSSPLPFVKARTYGFMAIPQACLLWGKEPSRGWSTLTPASPFSWEPFVLRVRPVVQYSIQKANWWA